MVSRMVAITVTGVAPMRSTTRPASCVPKKVSPPPIR